MCNMIKNNNSNYFSAKIDQISSQVEILTNFMFSLNYNANQNDSLLKKVERVEGRLNETEKSINRKIASLQSTLQNEQIQR